MQQGYIELMWTLPWLHKKLGEFEHEESEEMLRKVCNICLQRIHLIIF